MRFILLTCLVLLTTDIMGFPSSNTLLKKEQQKGLPSLTMATDMVQQQLCFIENKGQVTDQFGKARTDIDFKIDVPGMHIFFGDCEIHYMLNRNPSGVERIPASIQDHLLNITSATEMYRLDVALLGANKKANITIEEEQEYSEIYYLPQCREGIVAHSCKKIVYHNIYPFIDWVLYIKNDQLEYDFVIRPGGNVSNIQLAYHGATDFGVNQNGIAAVTPLGTITEKQPYSYSLGNNLPVPSEFIRNGTTISFKVAPYKGTLVIDPNPSLDWGTYYGGHDGAEVNNITCDTTGNVFMGGYTFSSSNIATTGSYQTTKGGTRQNAFVTKFNSAGTRLWGTYYGGNNVEQGLAVACDLAGNVYLTGESYSAGLATTGAYQTTNNGGDEAFLVKFNSMGIRQWATYYGGSGIDQARAVTCDGSGNVYITGATSSASSIATVGSHQLVMGSTTNTYDAFLAKFNSTGALKWATYYGGSSIDVGNAVTCDNTGNVYLTGRSQSANNIATSGSVQPSLAGASQNAFLVKFNGAGQRQWATYYGQAGDGTGIACDQSGHVYLCGDMDATGYATSGSFQTAAGTWHNAFLAQFNVTGSLQWSTYYGGNSTFNTTVACDAVGNAFMVGSVNSTSTNVATTGSYSSSYGNIFLAKFNQTGQRIWGTYYGGPGALIGNLPTGIACYGGKYIYIGGVTQSLTGISTPGSFQPAYGGVNTDGFLAKFSTSAKIEVIINEPFTDTVFCGGGTFSLNLNYGVTDTFKTGNVFTAQLSDALGSFAHPANIGTLASSINGTISCVIPAGTAYGTGYKIRIISSNLPDTSLVTTETISIINLSLMTASASSGCLGTTITLSADSLTAGQTYHWTGPHGFSQAYSTVNIPNSTYADSGNYVVVSVAGGCTKTDTVHVNIVPGPVKPIAASNSPVCMGDTILLKGSNITTGAAFSWSGPVGFHSFLLNPVLTSVPLSDSGLYILTADLDGCKQSDTVLVMVTKPTVPVVTITSTSPVKPGVQISFKAHPVGCPHPTYQWYNGAVALNGQTDSTLTIVMGQNNSIKVVMHCDGCVTQTSATSNSLSVGIEPLTIGGGNILIYPNPVNRFFTIENAMGVTARLYNVLGQTLVIQTLTSSKEVINTSTLPAGTFVLELIDESGTKWSKLMLKE